MLTKSLQCMKARMVLNFNGKCASCVVHHVAGVQSDPYSPAFFLSGPRSRVETMLIVPYRSLSVDALEGVLDEYIGREGTDYGSLQQTLVEKRLRLLEQLESGQAVISYDPISETTSLISATEVDL